jgi:uncharacterized protein
MTLRSVSVISSVLLLLTGSFSAVAAPPAKTPADSGRPIVIGRSYTLPSKLLGGERRINVYLPPGYSDAKRSFPVLYLLDGGEAEDFHHITGLVQVAAFNGRTQELIVVGIEGVDRKHDLTSPSKVPHDRELAPTSGGAATYRRFLVEELKPWVAARYRTNGRSALIGESLAGLFVTETFLRAPKSFDDYIAISPSLWWDGESLSQEAAALLRTEGFRGRHLYLSIANEGGEMQSGVDRLVHALKSKKPEGLDWRFDPRPDERHDTIYHPAALTALRALFPLSDK